MPAFAPRPAELEAYAGTYCSEEIDTTYAVFVEEGKLKVRFRPAQLFELSPVYEDAFARGSTIMRFTRGGLGRVDGFRIFTGRVRHLRFVRKDECANFRHP